jgi:hypothetical protein
VTTSDTRADMLSEFCSSASHGAAHVGDSLGRDSDFALHHRCRVAGAPSDSLAGRDGAESSPPAHPLVQWH